MYKFGLQVSSAAVVMFVGFGCSSDAPATAMNPTDQAAAGGATSGAPTTAAAGTMSSSGTAGTGGSMAPSSTPTAAAGTNAQQPIAAGSGGGGPAATAGADAPPAAGTGSAAMPSAPVNAWLRMGYDHRNNYHNPVETTISVATAPMLKELWRFDVAGFPPGSPVVVDGKVYALATGGMYAIDLATGKKLWERTDIGGTASAAYDDGFVYVHAFGKTKVVGELSKLKAEDGTTVWGPITTYDLDNCDGMSSPMLADGKVFVGHSCGVRELALDGSNKGPRGGVEAFNIENGERVYTYWSVPESGEDGAMSWSTVSVDFEDKAIFAATGNNYTVGGPNSDAIHKFDLATGMRIWVSQVRADDVWGLTTGNVKDTDFGANPILADVGGMKLVAAGDKGSAFWAMDRATGKILWSREQLTPSRGPATGGVLNNGAFDGKHFYVVANDPNSGTSTLFKLDPLTGKDVWTKTFMKIVWGAPSLANGVLVAPINDDLYILNAETGDVLTMFNTGGTTAGGAAAIAAGKIVVKSGLEYALSADVRANNQIICYGLP